MNDRRNFFRHPVSMPIHISRQRRATPVRVDSLNVGAGGLAFLNRTPLARGNLIRVTIPHVEPPFEATGVVCWCRRCDGRHEVGVSFLDEDTMFRVRMVEQVCHIEAYRRKLRMERGEGLSFDEAAAEWIERYAADFGHDDSRSPTN